MIKCRLFISAVTQLQRRLNQGVDMQAKELSLELDKKIVALCENLSDSKNLQENPNLYVNAFGCYAPHSSFTFDLERVLKEKLSGDDCQVVLLLAEAGSGKSLFGQTIVRKMAQNYEKGQPIPLFVPLPSLKNPKQDIMKEVLTRYGFTEEEIAELKITQTFFLILDAYDEIHLLENLIQSNQLTEWQVKIMITCRPTYLADVPNYRMFFMPFNKGKGQESLLHELYVAPFSHEQIGLYIKKYLEVHYADIQSELKARPELTSIWLEDKAYLDGIGEIPGLKNLILTPFLLRITMEVLPTIMAEYAAITDKKERFKMTQVKLYDAFVNNLFRREEEKLIFKGEHPGRNLKNAYLKFAKDLALKMHQKKITQVTYEGEDVFDPDSESEWAFYFCDQMIPSDKGSKARQQMRILSRRACPLMKVGENQFAFLHASIFEYFFTLAMHELSRQSPMSKPTVPIEMSREKEKEKEPISEKKIHKVSGKKILQGNTGRSYELLKKLDAEDAKKLLKEEGIEKAALGKGHFGQADIARCVSNNRFVVVKKIQGKDKILSSKNEASLQSNLSGLPHLLPLWDFIPVTKPSGKEIYYQFMPIAGLGNGDKFQKHWHLWPGTVTGCEGLDTKPTFKLRLLVQIAQDVLIGIHQMHLHSIYHLDLKGSNIVIDHFGQVFIIDFGCSQRSASLTGEKDLIRIGQGDINYYSPERLASLQEWQKTKTITKNLDAAKLDSWAVGVMLLQMLLDSYPFNNFNANKWQASDFDNGLKQIPGFANPPAESLMAVIKGLLALTPDNRLSAGKALALPIFQRKDLLFTTPFDRQKAFMNLYDEEKREEASYSSTSSDEETCSSIIEPYSPLIQISENSELRYVDSAEFVSKLKNESFPTEESRYPFAKEKVREGQEEKVDQRLPEELFSPEHQEMSYVPLDLAAEKVEKINANDSSGFKRNTGNKQPGFFAAAPQSEESSRKTFLGARNLSSETTYTSSSQNEKLSTTTKPSASPPTEGKFRGALAFLRRKKEKKNTSSKNTETHSHVNHTRQAKGN